MRPELPYRIGRYVVRALRRRGQLCTVVNSQSSTYRSGKVIQTNRATSIISAHLTQALQQAIVENSLWLQVAPGLEVSELAYQLHEWGGIQRIVVVRQHVQRKAGSVAGKTLPLFADDADLQGWRTRVRQFSASKSLRGL